MDLGLSSRSKATADKLIAKAIESRADEVGSGGAASWTLRAHALGSARVELTNQSLV